MGRPLPDTSSPTSDSSSSRISDTSSSTPDSSSSLSRRAFLGSAIGAAALRTLPIAAAAPADLTVMTRNLYLGVDLFELFGAQSMADVRRITGSLLEDALDHPYRARAEAIAAEIEAAEPDVVAVQEAALIRTQRPGDFGSEDDAKASSVAVDVLDHLASALADRGLSYDVTASVVTTDIELPADVDDQQVDVRLTDRDALLTRSEVETESPQSGTYDASFSVPMGGRTFTVRRGYCHVTATVGDATYTVASTHLEAVSGDVRTRQAEELLALLPSDRPVILAGDFNSGPGTSTEAYDLLTESFEDAYAVRWPDADGFTCCHAADLGNEQSRLSRRIDAVLYGGGVRPTAASRVGHESSDRLPVEVNGETERVWPSDHAGVVAAFETAPAGTATSGTAVPTTSPSDTQTGPPASNGTATATPSTSGTETATVESEPVTAESEPATAESEPATAAASTPTETAERDTAAAATDSSESQSEVRVHGFGFAAAVGGIVAAALNRYRRTE